jgi:hypothetical protein
VELAAFAVAGTDGALGRGVATAGWDQPFGLNLDHGAALAA